MGRKYIIELENISFQNGDEYLWRVKGFKSLVFDKNGLEKLTPYYEPWKVENPENEYNVGDEVVSNNTGIAIVVTGIYKNSVVGFDRDGHTHSMSKSSVSKTGKTYDRIKDYVCG